MTTVRRTAALLAAGTLLTAAAACSGGDRPGRDGAGSPASTAPPSAPSTTPLEPTPSPSPSSPAGSADATAAQAALARLSLAERVGQLFMVAIPAGGRSVAAVQPGSGRHIGNVMLAGRSRDPAAQVAALARTVRAAAVSVKGDVLPFVATDQEGGAVQVLSGAGFAAIPSAKVQGTWSATTLQQRATVWARQLRAAGVNLNLAPVADTVPGSAAAQANPPIGRFDRGFGYTPGVVGTHSLAFMTGLHRAGVATSVKHFPGLGYVHANTDTTTDVVDGHTTPTSPSLQPFRAAVQAGAPLVMVSNATYARIDGSRPAPFSAPVITGLLRGELGFDGVTISDDLGAARQVRRWSPGSRAVAFLGAGGDLVLTVDPSTVSPMYDAVLARARTSPAFRAKVVASTLRVLTAKARFGLLRPP